MKMSEDVREKDHQVKTPVKDERFLQIGEIKLEKFPEFNHSEPPGITR